MTKILGLDLGTASIGWALVERNDTGYALLDQGVDIFQEGVAREKNSEKPAVQDRPAARALRRRRQCAPHRTARGGQPPEPARGRRFLC